MNEVDKPSVNNFPTGRSKLEPAVNHNHNDRKSLVIRKESQVSLSSVSDCLSDESEDYGVQIERKTSLQEFAKKVDDKRILYKQRGRSMSDGETRRIKNDDSTFEVFPSLPNSVLEKLGLRGDGPREHMNEEELEQKFTSLALAFTIDATTIKDRCERQRRSRDQTENNLTKEIEKLREKLTFMQPLCKDYETAEIFSTIMTQLDIIMNAASLASMSAERFGSVQHEERLTESVGLMVSHVQMLKQQRDATRRQLQYTKRVLQNSADSPTRGINSLPSNNHQLASPTSPGLKIISKRRASIATFAQPPNENNPNRTIIETKKITRRTSDLNLRTGVLCRRPTRLELGGELVKIKEGYAETSNESEKTSDVESEETCFSTPNVSSPEEEPTKDIDVSKLPLREQLIYRFKSISTKIEDKYNIWTQNGKMHEIYTFCAVICFSLSLILLLNILAEYEFAKRGIFSWTWTDETQKKFNNVKN
uniref:Lymphoid-restricted membrane protein-like isoform X1 n=1 Tax=Diabrotica virgifera virgifera TaxID=50390 RepID=A0A6P7F8S0_DIAVI